MTDEEIVQLLQRTTDAIMAASHTALVQFSEALCAEVNRALAETREIAKRRATGVNINLSPPLTSKRLERDAVGQITRITEELVDVPAEAK